MAKRMFLAAAVTGFLLVGPAFGHAKLRGSQPAADARLEIAPTTLTLTFNENVQPAVLTLSLDGKNIPVTLSRDRPASPQVSVALPTMSAGKYRVQWSVLAVDDGHVSKGEFSFDVVGTAAAIH